METSVNEAHTLKDLKDSLRGIDYEFFFTGSTKLANLYADAKKIDPKFAEEIKKAEKLIGQARAIIYPLKSGV